MVAMLLLFWVVSYAMFAGFGAVVLILIANNLIAQQSKLFTNK
jgi:Flp pilus assembly pilin Flp